MNTVNDNKWHFVIGIRKGNRHQIYLDGKIQTDEVLEVRNINNPNEIIGIGRNGDKDEAYFFGTIDDISIYNYALNTAAIDSLYHLGGWPLDTTSGLLAYYPFNGDAKDESGNGNDLTLGNSPQFVTGKLGQALDFEANSQQYAYNLTLPAPQEVRTIALWFKAETANVSQYEPRGKFRS